MTLRGKNSQGFEDLQIITHDKKLKRYRYWYYDSNGAYNELKGDWNNDTYEFASVAKQDDRQIAEAKGKYVRKM